MSLEEVETTFFVRSLADLSRHFFAASPKPQGRYTFPAASFWNSLTAESTAHWAQWHCNQAHIANHFAFRFQGPAHSMILGSCCTEKIEQCGIRVEPHQKSAYSEMNWTELNNLVQSMNGKDHLICTWRTTFLPPGSSCRSLETFALQPLLQTMDQPQKKTRETATVSCTILLPVWGILVGGCHIPCPVSFVLFLPQKPQAQICLSRIISSHPFPNWNLLSFPCNVHWKRILLQMPSTPPNATARASFPSVKPCSEERRTSAGLGMWVGGQEICDHGSWEMVDVFCCNNAPGNLDYHHCGFQKFWA